MKRLVILTLEYPYGKGESFLSTELDFYAKENVEVILVPFKKEGSARNLPNGISVDVGHDNWPGWPAAFREFITKGWFWKEVFTFFHHLVFRSSRISFLFFLKTAIIQRNKLLQLNATKQINPSDTVIYSYWLGGLTGGAILFNQGFRNSFKIISRAHGGDVYEYRYKPAYIPFRVFVLSGVDFVAAVSQDGMKYLKQKYSVYAEKISCHYLGTKETGFACKASSDGVFRIVSCAYVSPVKRLHLLADGLIAFQHQSPQFKIHWTHIGGGEELDDLKKSSSQLNKTVTCDFLGDQTPSQIMDFYRTNAVDVFVNTSSSEGMPVSIIEAMSVGIPVLATNVGGVEEMVDESCGKLLPPDISPDQLAEELLYMIQNVLPERRHGALKKWQELFDGKKNYARFRQSIS